MIAKKQTHQNIEDWIKGGGGSIPIQGQEKCVPSQIKAARERTVSSMKAQFI